MDVRHDTVVQGSARSDSPQGSALNRQTLSGVEAIRAGRVEPFLNIRPALSSAEVLWRDVALEDYTIPACSIPRHEHLEHFLHVVLRESTKHEVSTKGRTLTFTARPGTSFILPPGTVDEMGRPNSSFGCGESLANALALYLLMRYAVLPQKSCL